MNKMIDKAIDQFYKCKVITKENRSEAIKPTTIPSRSWDSVAHDFGEPYQDRHYTLVMVDQRFRYPVVETMNTSSSRETEAKVKEIFTTYGTPRRVQTFNRPPFQSKEFANFTTVEGVKHYMITSLYP